jgi:hypothetical protein
MALKIRGSDLVTQRHLLVDSGGVEFKETALMGGARRFAFAEIDSLVISAKGVLSFQVGREVFSIPTKKGDRAHQEVIDTLVRELKASSS